MTVSTASFLRKAVYLQYNFACNMKEQDLRHLRIDYAKHSLSETDAGNDPFQLFTSWFTEALSVEAEANAFVIATANQKPSARVVLLKELRRNAFVFFTNYESKKAKDIEANPRVSMLFFWQQLQRQVRVEGIASRVSAEESDSYFYARPIESQIGAIASAQSRTLNDRLSLESKFAELTEKYKTEPIVRPDFWGGFEIVPQYFEFWQGRSSRLHDRIEFELKNNEWQKARLYP